MKSINALSIAATGKATAYTGTSAGATIPVGADGNVPNFCYVVATSDAHVRWGQGAQTAITTDAFFPAKVPIIIRTIGCTHYAAIQDSAGGSLMIAPLEWVR